MKTQVFSRRAFVARLAVRTGVVVSATHLVTACDKKESARDEDRTAVDFCDDLSAVSENDLALRKKFAYVDKSPIEDNQCDNCNLFLPPKSEQRCGGCMLFKGPVDKSGYCTYWAPKVEE